MDYKDMNLCNFYRCYSFHIYHIVVCQAFFKFQSNKTYFFVCHEPKPIICQNFLSKTENSYLME